MSSAKEMSLLVHILIDFKSVCPTYIRLYGAQPLLMKTQLLHMHGLPNVSRLHDHLINLLSGANRTVIFSKTVGNGLAVTGSNLAVQPITKLEIFMSYGSKHQHNNQKRTVNADSRETWLHTNKRNLYRGNVNGLCYMSLHFFERAVLLLTAKFSFSAILIYPANF